MPLLEPSETISKSRIRSAVEARGSIGSSVAGASETGRGGALRPSPGVDFLFPDLGGSTRRFVGAILAPRQQPAPARRIGLTMPVDGSPEGDVRLRHSPPAAKRIFYHIPKITANGGP